MVEQLQAELKQAYLETYAAGMNVLAKEADTLRSAVGILAVLSPDEADGTILPLAADMAVEGNQAHTAVEILPVIQKVVQPLTPKQTDPNAAPAQRWTMDWGAVGKVIQARVAESPYLHETLDRWFLTDAANMVETTYGSTEKRRPVIGVVGGANDQSSFRPILALAALATPDFRYEYGLITKEEHGLSGEDERQAGWLKDETFVAGLFEHVSERITQGDIEPKLFVTGSGGRVLVGKEAETAAKYLRTDVPLLYPDRGVTEADNMLAGAIKEFHGEVDSLTITDIPTAGTEDPSDKIITFTSPLGTITVAVGQDKKTSLLDQMTLASQHKPELFEDIDALELTTTAIYTWVQRPALLELAARLELPEAVGLNVLGISAHAAGMERKIGTLVGELTKYLQAMYGTAVRMLESAEFNTQYDLALLGALALQDNEQQN